MVKLPDYSKLFIAFSFWNVITKKPRTDLSEADKIKFDLIYGRISKNKAIKKLKSLKSINTGRDLEKSVEKFGVNIIYQAAGGQNFLDYFIDTITKLRILLPNVKIGIAEDDIHLLGGLLEEKGISEKLDFVLISGIINYKKSDPNFFDSIPGSIIEKRIVLVETYIGGHEYMINIEPVEYDNRLTTNDLYEIIKEYLGL